MYMYVFGTLFIELYPNDLTNKNEKKKKKQRKTSHILIEISKCCGTRNRFTGLFFVHFDLFVVAPMADQCTHFCSSFGIQFLF